MLVRFQPPDLVPALAVERRFQVVGQELFPRGSAGWTVVCRTMSRRVQLPYAGLGECSREYILLGTTLSTILVAFARIG